MIETPVTRRTFSEADLFHLAALRGVVPVQEIAWQMDRNRSSIYHAFAQLDRLQQTPARFKAPWTPEEDEFIQDFYGVWPNLALAWRLGRTVKAMQFRARKLAVWRRDNYWSATAIAALFGVSIMTVKRWMLDGLLPCQRHGYGRQRLHHSSQAEDIERFIREFPWRYDRTRIEAGTYFRALAEQVWRADPLRTTAEVAERLGWTVRQARRAVGRGQLRGYVGTKGYGQAPWLVRESDLVAYSQAKGRKVESQADGAQNAQNRVLCHESGIVVTCPQCGVEVPDTPAGLKSAVCRNCGHREPCCEVES